MQSETIRVVAAVIRDGDLLLVCQRPPHKRHGGLWEFPGGKCEPGESDYQATERELREELEVQVLTVGQPEFLSIDQGSPFVIAFVPVTIVGQPICKEHITLAWRTLEELLFLPLAPSDRRFVDLCAAQGPRPDILAVS